MKLSRLLIYYCISNFALAAHGEVAATPPTTPRYSTLAACETVLSNLRRRVTSVSDGERVGTVDFNARPVLPALDRIAQIAGTDKKPDKAEANVDDLEQIIQNIAAKPNYRTSDGFAVTDVYEGTAAIEAYLNTSESQTLGIEDEAYRNMAPRLFTKGRMRRSLATLVASTGALGAVWAVSFATPFVVQSYAQVGDLALMAMTASLSGVGTLATLLALDSHVEWAVRLLRSNRSPQRRRAAVEKVWNFDQSEYFSDLSAMFKAKAVLEELRKGSALYDQMSATTHSRLSYVMPREHLDRLLDLPADQLHSQTVQFLSGRRAENVPRWVMPSEFTSETVDSHRAMVAITNIVVLDPKTRDLVLIVHARGDYLNDPSKSR